MESRNIVLPKIPAEENARLSSASPRPRPSTVPGYNLPIPLSSFIGRAQEIVQVKRLLSAARLVTMTGMGGCGKTRLALQVAAGLTNEYAAGVWLVELAALMDPSFVSQTVAASLGVCEQPCCTLTESLIDFLREKHLLLILDNCEHVIRACAELAELLLQACPHLVMLTTSREPLGIPGEFTFDVPAFALPESRVPFSIETLMRSEAVQLFVERAVAAQPRFQLTAENAAAVVQICRQLDGIPLAIELAAARIRTLTVEQIAARLAAHDRFDLLTVGSRMAMPRQQTLRGAVDWSYQLLGEKEQILFRRLAVFAGGWSLEAAEAICAQEETKQKDEIHPSEMLDLLTQLASKSLFLVEERHNQARYRMLDTIRQYARDRLVESGEQERIRDRHLDFFCRWMEEAETHLRGPDQVVWFNRLEMEFDNLRAALEWSLEDGDGRAQVGLRLAAAEYWFWFLRDHRSEGRVWLDRVLARNLPASTAVQANRATVLCGAGFLATWERDLERASAISEESLALFRKLGDEGGVGRALYNLALVANHREDYGRGSEFAEASAVLLRKVGDKGNLAWSLNALGDAALRQKNYAGAGESYREALALSREIGDITSIAWLLPDISQVLQFQGEYERAIPLLEESMDLFQKLGGKTGIPYTLAQLGQVALHQGDYEKAEAWCEESLSDLRELGYTESIHWPLDLLGITACRRGQFDRAAAFFKEALTANKRFGYRQGIAENLSGLGAVGVELGQLESAVKLFGAAEALLEVIGTDLGPADREQYDRYVAQACDQLDEETFASLWAEGRALPVEQAIDYAAQLTMVAQPAPSPRRATKREFGGLTPRERQVAALVAQGKSNHTMAEELVLSERTVENHVGNILAKLGFCARAQIAAWAIEKGLGKNSP